MDKEREKLLIHQERLREFRLLLEESEFHPYSHIEQERGIRATRHIDISTPKYI